MTWLVLAQWWPERMTGAKPSAPITEEYLTRELAARRCAQLREDGYEACHVAVPAKGPLPDRPLLFADAELPKLPKKARRLTA